MKDNWLTIFRIFAKAALFFVAFNLLFAAAYPRELLGSISLYNTVLRGRERLPYGENPDESYNLSLNNIPAMMASHVVSRPKEADEYRILIPGDSGTWGWLLVNDQTLAAIINKAKLQSSDGRRVTAYNIGYPVMSVTKDLLLLEAALALDPDLVIWPVTLQSFHRESQLDHPLLQENPDMVRKLIEEYDLDFDLDDDRFIDPGFWEKSIVGQRRQLADLLRLQTYGFSWSATGIDQAVPEEIILRSSDFDADPSWQDVDSARPLTDEDLTWDVLQAGIDLAADFPVLIVNEPIFISEGLNSDVRYNAWYPRWAYDDYREQLQERAETNGWHFLDLWDDIEPENFTDSPVHLDAEGTERYGSQVLQSLRQFGLKGGSQNRE